MKEERRMLHSCWGMKWMPGPSRTEARSFHRKVVLRWDAGIRVSGSGSWGPYSASMVRGTYSWHWDAFPFVPVASPLGMPPPSCRSFRLDTAWTWRFASNRGSCSSPKPPLASSQASFQASFQASSQTSLPTSFQASSSRASAFLAWSCLRVQ